jgi:pre-mRNA-splicing factor RBM22/SLT11
MATVKRDNVKQAWEDTEFPLVCETCLGDNPYIRMTKESHGKRCQVCDTPFTVFAWQAGTKGRMKRVEICKSCAQAKNVCQVCIYDLQYGLPVKVRDEVLREMGSSSAVAAVPQSQANRAWYSAQQSRLLEQGDNLVGDVNELAHAKLSEMAQMKPNYERNLAKLCTFYARGECDRGTTCPFRHEFPRDRNDPMCKQSTKDRFFGGDDPVASKMLGRKATYEQEQKKEEEEIGYETSRATLYVRFRGEEPYPNLTEGDVRDKFYAFGEIVSARVQANRGQAFVEYTQPDAAELAIASMNRKQLLGRELYVSWARAPKRGETMNTEQAKTSAPTVVRPVAPPGTTKRSLPKGLSAATKPNKAAKHSGADVARPAAPYPSADPDRLGSIE